MNVRELINFMSSNEDAKYSFKEFLNDTGYGARDLNTILEPYDFEFRGEESYGGEGMGERCWTVFSVTKYGEDFDQKFFRVDGYYASYHGFEWGNLFRWKEVEKAQKMVDYWKEI